MWTFSSTKGCFVLSGWYLPQGIVNVKNYKTDDLSFNVRWTETNAPKGHFNPKIPERAFYSRCKGNGRPGIETGSKEWESCMIPLHQRRVFLHHDTIFGSVMTIQLRSALFRTLVLSQLYTTEIRAITPSQFYTPQIRTITKLYNSFFLQLQTTQIKFASSRRSLHHTDLPTNCLGV